MCCEPIGESYLRELTTRLSYCSYACYLGHCKLAMSVLVERAKLLANAFGLTFRPREINDRVFRNVAVQQALHRFFGAFTCSLG